ncbi:hypothetical protein ACFQ3R_06600 [Mesonia ostreae]|uniref:DUF4168 domain-containing protein n=1 Tax=Mesonia ostreae TaxID=861110 RepID=A0ABU2KGZ4_9FLAO|nr:hypothetical protein [Mesonia ostreae]MDT0293990.1 hypothetical protein [Mesonia ostreae]
MRKIISFIALSIAFLAFTPEMNAQDSKKTEEMVRAETMKQVDMLSESFNLNANDQEKLHRSLYAYNINTTIHTKNVTEKDDAYYANKKKFDKSLIEGFKTYLKEDQINKLVKMLEIELYK